MYVLWLSSRILGSSILTLQFCVGSVGWLPELVGCPMGTTIQCNRFIPMVEKLEIQGYEKANLGMHSVGGYLDYLAY